MGVLIVPSRHGPPRRPAAIVAIMGLGEWCPLTYFEGEGSVEPTGPREYAITGSYEAFMQWRQADLSARRHVSYLTRERAEQLVAASAPRGTLHRLPGWETSEARELAERLAGPE